MCFPLYVFATTVQRTLSHLGGWSRPSEFSFQFGPVKTAGVNGALGLKISSNISDIYIYFVYFLISQLWYNDSNPNNIRYTTLHNEHFYYTFCIF